MGTTWKAIADDNRRKLLLLLNEGEKTPKQMASNFDFTLAALSNHLRILKEAGLITERKEGRNRVYSLTRENLSDMTLYFDRFWTDKLGRLKDHVESKEKVRR